MSLIGTIGEVKIADVLRLFAAGKKSGLLTVALDPQHKAVLRFEKGALVQAASGRIQGDEAVLDLFGWKTGQLTFVPDESPGPRNVTRPVDALILEGLRVGESLHRMNELVPNDRVVFDLAPGPSDEGARYALGSLAWRVVRALDGVRDVKEVVEASRIPRADVVKVLVEMADLGFLERVEPAKSLRVQAAAGLFQKDSAEVDERYEAEWMRSARFARGVQKVQVKTLAGRMATVSVTFRAGLFRDVQLPKATLAELGAREGEDVTVRPVR